MWSLNIKFPIAPTTNEAYVPCRQRTHSSVRISRGRPLSREGGDTLSTEEEKTFGLHWSNGRQAGRQAGRQQWQPRRIIGLICTQPLRWVTLMPQGALFLSPKQDGMSIKIAQQSFVFSQCIKLRTILMSEMQVHTTKSAILMQILTPIQTR